MRLLLLLVVGALGDGDRHVGTPRGGRKERVAVAAGVIALLVITADAFILRPARLAGNRPADHRPVRCPPCHHGLPAAGRRPVGPRESSSWSSWHGCLEACRASGASSRQPSLRSPVARWPWRRRTLALARGAAAATGLAALIVMLAVEGPAAVAAATRELRVTLVAGAMLLAVVAVVPIAARLALIAAGVGSDAAADAATSVAGPVMGLIAVALGLAVAGRWGMLPFHVRVSEAHRPGSARGPCPSSWPGSPCRWPSSRSRRWTGCRAARAAARRRADRAGPPGRGDAAPAPRWRPGSRMTSAASTGYLVIAECGLLLLAIAALDPAAWGPGRAWVVVLAASKSALAAWAAVTEDRSGPEAFRTCGGSIRRRRSSRLRRPHTVAPSACRAGWRSRRVAWCACDRRGGAPRSSSAGLLTLPTYYGSCGRARAA